MAVFLLMTIAVLLALYYNSKLSQALNNFIKSLLNKVNNYKRSHTNESTTITASDGENVESSELYFTKTEVRSTPGIWDIPGPKRFPLIGTKWIFLAYFWKYKLSGLPKVYADLNAKYGDIILEVTTSGVPIVHLFKKADLEKILKHPSKYPFRPPTQIVVAYRRSKPERYASVGIVNEQGPTWHKLRSSLTSSLTSPRTLHNFLPALNLICDDFIEMLKKQRDPVTHAINNFDEIANLIGLEAICALVLGRRMGFLSIHNKKPERAQKLAAAVKQLFISQRDSYYGIGLWKYLPTPTYQNFAKAEDVIYDIISEMFEEALSLSLSDGNLNNDDDDEIRHIFINILQLKDVDIRDKKSAIIDFIAAGIETLANTLLFIMNSVTSDPKVVQKIREEFQEYQDSIILQDAFTHATYTKACIQECYRITPTAVSLARILDQDMELSGYHLKAGTIVNCQNMLACHKDENFENAQTFRPERWLDRNGNFTINIESSTLVVPFGIGKRTCPGKRFVEMEIILLLAKLLLAFDISFTKPLEAEFEFLLAPKTPLQLILRDRVL